MAITERENRKFGLNSLVLRIIAMLALTWGTVAEELLPDIRVDWFNYTMWFAYTIFAFLLVEGLSKTSDRRLYLRRMILFAVLTEIPFDLLTSGRPWNIARQSVMVNLLIGFIVILITDYIKQNLDNMIATLVGIIALAFLGIRLVYLLNCDMGFYGIAIICFFYICKNVTYNKLLQVICCIVFMMYITADNYLNIMINDLYYSIPDKGFIVIGVIFTWFYNGKRGPNNIVLKVLYYLYFPLMLLIVYFIKTRIFS